MAAAFPLIKLASLATNYAAKPLAEAAKRKAKSSPFFRNYLCIPPANLYHWCDVKLTMLSKNITGKAVHIPPLKESRAIELGAELVGDAVIFIVGSSIFILEYFRRAHNQGLKDMEAAQQMKVVISDLQTLFTAKAELEEKVKELVRIVEEKLNVDFQPNPIDIANIPKHHIQKDEPVEEPVDASTLGKTKAWLYTAIDYILTKLM